MTIKNHENIKQLGSLQPADKQSNANPACWNHPTEPSQARETQRERMRKLAGGGEGNLEEKVRYCPGLDNDVLWFISPGSSFCSSHPMALWLPTLPYLPHTSSPLPEVTSLSSVTHLLPCASACLSPVVCRVSFPPSLPAEILSGFRSGCTPSASPSFLSVCVDLASGSPFRTATVTL